MNGKRNRSINWDEVEKQLLRSVLKEYAHVIENKCIDTNTNKIKAKAWEQVHQKFNQLNCRPRELSQLKIQWKGMKVTARKSYSSFKKEVNKTGGGARPPTPNDAVIEIKDLLNPAELLRDTNIFDSDGIVAGELETPSEITPSKLQEMSVEIIDVGAQMTLQEFNPLVVSSDMSQDVKDLLQISKDETMATPTKKNTGVIPGKKVAKRKLSSILESAKKPRKEHEDYAKSMLSHSKMLKDDEHMRLMEMAEEKHTIEMEILREKLKSAILEREILDLKKNKQLKILYLFYFLVYKGCLISTYQFKKNTCYILSNIHLFLHNYSGRMCTLS